MNIKIALRGYVMDITATEDERFFYVYDAENGDEIASGSFVNGITEQDEEEDEIEWVQDVITAVYSFEEDGWDNIVEVVPYIIDALDKFSWCPVITIKL